MIDKKQIEIETLKHKVNEQKAFIMHLKRLYGSARRWELSRTTQCHKCHVDADAEFFAFMRAMPHIEWDNWGNAKK